MQTHPFNYLEFCAFSALHIPKVFFLCCSFQALYSYVPQNDDELELREGDLVSVMEKCDDGWFVGMWIRIHSFALTLSH